MPMLILWFGYLLMMAGVVGVLAWAYRHTRLPAVVAYTAWLLASQLLFPVGHKLIIDALVRSGTRLPFDVEIGSTGSHDPVESCGSRSAVARKRVVFPSGMSFVNAPFAFVLPVATFFVPAKRL